MKRFHDDFPSLLRGFTLETLESDPNSIYGLSADLTINYLNPGWFSFAAENMGEPAISERFALGTHIGECMSGPVRDYYLDEYQGLLLTGEVWHHDYECSSPDVFRVYHQSVYPLYDRNGLVVVNSLVTEQTHEADLRTPCQPSRHLYTKETGFITQCCNCRRVQHASREDMWDWVPAWVAQMPKNTSHSFCRICYEYYYACKYTRGTASKR